MSCLCQLMTYCLLSCLCQLMTYCLLFACLHIGTSILNTENFFRGQAGRMLSKAPLLTLTVRSQLDCATNCMAQDGCGCILYKAALKECRLYTDGYGASTPEDGWISMIIGDMDECTAGFDNCHADAACTNTFGSFACTCNAGYNGDGVNCADEDECTAGSDTCSADATCTNTAGSFTCTCNVGYNGDGVTCAECNTFGNNFTLYEDHVIILKDIDVIYSQTSESCQQHCIVHIPICKSADYNDISTNCFLNDDTWYDVHSVSRSETYPPYNFYQRECLFWN